MSNDTLAKIFTIESIPELRNKLTSGQKQLLEQIWIQYSSSFDTSFSIRAIPSIFRNQAIEEAFDGLNGSLIYENYEAGGRSFSLTIYGAFLTGYGLVLASLLVRLLDMVRELYEKDTFFNALNKEGIKTYLELSEADAKHLFNLLRLGLPGLPIYLSGWHQSGDTWAVTITDEVINLFRSESTIAYLDALLSENYDEEMPWSYEERMKHQFRGPSMFSNMPPMMLDVTPDARDGTSELFITQERIEALKNIRSLEFDLARLVCICEELNQSASRKNAHAVIMLTRAILDHIPPVFGHKSFTEVASNYGGGGRSFKDSAERLESHSRKVADRLLHMQIRNKELEPSMREVSFSAELESVLAELCRQLK